MVRLVTNRTEYANDVAEVIRLFLGNAVVSVAPFSDVDAYAPTDLIATLLCTPESFLGKASFQGNEEQFCMPRTDDSALAVKRDEKRTVKIAVYRLLRSLYDTKTPWGSLTGIRPTKLMRESEARLGHDGAVDLFLNTFDVSPAKTALAESICSVQKPIIQSASPKDIDIYIGIPYCKSRCLYCSFGSLLAKDPSVLESYLSLLEKDIAAGAKLVQALGYRVRSMYFGGGTPTVLSADQLDRLLSTVRSAYAGFGTECTVEAGRPDTICRDKLSVIFDHGVRRISVNPQTMNDDTLNRIGRAHTSEETVKAFYMAREAGFSIINMDLITGLPGETEEAVQRTLARVAELHPENLTVHTLALKRSSRLKEHLDEYPMPDPDTVERMVGMGYETAALLGMKPYYMYRQKYMQGNLENVGYAKPGKECIYNIDMMEETVSILAHGAGAMSKRVFGEESRIERLPNPKDVDTYRNKLPELVRRKFSMFSD